jgi:hypothetical protein
MSEKVLILLSCALVMVSTNIVYTDDYDELRLSRGPVRFIQAVDSPKPYDLIRTKRYPAHLEPNIMAMGSKFWIRPGGKFPIIQTYLITELKQFSKMNNGITFKLNRITTTHGFWRLTKLRFLVTELGFTTDDF